MMGKTHYRLGILYYILFNTVPFFAAIPFLNRPENISLAGIITAAFAALLPDADSQHSMINNMNPITGTANKTVEIVEQLLVAMIRLVFTVGAGILIIINSGKLIELISKCLYKIPQIAPYSAHIVYGAAIMLILAAFLDKKWVKRIPLYGMLKHTIDRAGSIAKRMILFTIYAGWGIWLIIYNHLIIGDNMLYLIGALFIAIAIFPHRSFLHSIEGLVLFTIAFTYITRRLGVPYLANAFFIGYFSHLYLSDILTDRGEQLSTIPRILKFTGLHGTLQSFKAYRLIFKLLNIRLCIPLTSTGRGSMFEAAYVMVLLLFAAAAGIIFITSGGQLKLI